MRQQAVYNGVLYCSVGFMTSWPSCRASCETMVASYTAISISSQYNIRMRTAPVAEGNTATSGSSSSSSAAATSGQQKQQQQQGGATGAEGPSSTQVDGTQENGGGGLGGGGMGSWGMVSGISSAAQNEFIRAAAANWSSGVARPFVVLPLGATDEEHEGERVKLADEI